MARKSTGEKSPSTQAPAEVSPSQPVEKALSPSDIIPEGDFAGMTYDEVLALTIESVHEAYKDLSLKGACAAHDAVMHEILVMMRYYEGPGEAHEAAVRFGQTLMEFLETPQQKLQRAYGQLVQLRHEWDRGE